ncbi:olfactory receptor 12-like [Malaclemys terrapin pileata]|uniref:olfactory receptor 9S13-like n=1 Tax=Chrysemys picta bellii TaxID=8478 RepID=UPI000CE6438A|nr:olfactory receptor 12-like [Chrysemys picta bellii]XP_053901867.1 olfactory receptor 12-like [Malaclemys terrapin pileata]
MAPVREGNCTAVTEFILQGFGKGRGLQVAPFVIFLVIYIVTMMGNTILVLIIRANSHLHTPMYFFLMNLSLVDLCYSSTITPKAMVSFLSGSKAISYNGCATQFFFFGLFITTEAFLLAVMGYDRYTAICNPLLYPVTMSKWVCIQLIVGSYICGCVNAIVQTSFTFTLHYCGSNEIDHFFCDGPPLINLSCSDTFLNNIVMFTLCGFIIAITALIVLISYFYVISTILRIRSAEGRRKAFSTCTSHLVAVTLFYGTTAFMYAQPTWLSSLYPRKAVSVFYTFVIPMLNPFIYSLRNKDVREGLCRAMGHKSMTK